MLDSKEGELLSLIQEHVQDAEWWVERDRRKAMEGGQVELGLTEPTLESVRRGAELQLQSYLSLLISDLVATLEATVLCENIFFLRGHHWEVREQVRQRTDCWPQERFWGWELFHADPDKAFDLANLIFSEFGAEPIGVSDSQILEVDIVLDTLRSMGMPVSELFTAFGSDGLDAPRFRSLCANNRELVEPSRVRVREKYAAFAGHVDEFLGPDWRAYKSHVSSAAMPDAGLLRSSYGMLRDTHDLRELSHRLANYAELKVATEHSSTLISNLADAGYYSSFVGQEECRSFGLRRACSSQYSNELERHLRECGMADISLSVPPVARMCLRGATTVREAMLNAAKLRKTRWAGSLRKHLTELCNQRGPVDTLRSMRRLNNLIETKIGRLGKLGLGGIGFSSTGAVSLSIQGLGQRLLEWKNPALLVNTRWISNLASQDSISDLARITKQPRVSIQGVLEKLRSDASPL